MSGVRDWKTISKIMAQLDAISASLEASTTKVAAIEKQDRDTYAKGGNSSFGVGRSSRTRSARKNPGLQLLRLRTRCSLASPSPRLGKGKPLRNKAARGSEADTAFPIADHLVCLVEPGVLHDCDVLAFLNCGGDSFLIDTDSPVSTLPWTATIQKVNELHMYGGSVLSMCGESLNIVGQAGLEMRRLGKVSEQETTTR